MKKLFLLLILVISLMSFSYKEETFEVFSNSMKKNIVVTVVLPETYNKDKKYPTIYTLHGWSGSNLNFIQKTPIGELADKYNVIFISPDGNYDSWYIDSKVDTKSKYMTFISKELVEKIDMKYATENQSSKRAITGLSMGGFGALYIGINNQKVFGNIGSMSGGVDVEAFKGNWGISKFINSNWEEYNIKDIAHKLLFTKSKIVIDIGVDDFFITANRELHQKLLELNIAHDYSERPGAHNWIFWSNAIKYQTMFFVNNFNEVK